MSCPRSVLHRAADFWDQQVIENEEVVFRNWGSLTIANFKFGKLDRSPWPENEPNHDDRRAGSYLLKVKPS
jgi:hypothetical protein